MGQRGPVGLDYNVLPMMFGLHEVPQSDQYEILQQIRIMEMAALKEIRSHG